MTTIRRQSTTGLRPLLAEVLKKHLSKYNVAMLIDEALELEKQLSCVAYDYFFPADNTKVFYDVFIDPKMRVRAAMVQRIEDNLRINTDDTPEWERVINFCIDQDQKGKPIEKYGEWYRSEEGKYSAPKAHQITLKPSAIIGTWPQAFPEKVEPAPQKTGAFYG